MLRTFAGHGEVVRLAVKLGQLLLVDVVHRGVVREQPRTPRRQLIAIDHPRGKLLAVNAGASIGTNGVEHVEKGLVVLPVLLRQITDERIEIAPGGRRMGKGCAEAVVLIGEVQHAGLGDAPARHRGQLKEISDQDHLQPAEGRGRFADVTAHRVHQGQAARRQHRDLVDDQDTGLFDSSGEPAVGGKHIQITAGERVAHADAAPGVNGDAMAMRGGDPGRGGIGVVDAGPGQVPEIAVDRMGLAAAGLAGEEDAGPGLEQRQRLVLRHCLSHPRSCPCADSSITDGAAANLSP